MKLTELMLICCGMTVKTLGMLRVSVRKMKALIVKMETVALVGLKVGRIRLAVCIKCTIINSIIFVLSRCFDFGAQIWMNALSLGRRVFFGGGGVRLTLESSCVRVNAVYTTSVARSPIAVFTKV